MAARDPRVRLRPYGDAVYSARARSCIDIVLVLKQGRWRRRGRSLDLWTGAFGRRLAAGGAPSWSVCDPARCGVASASRSLLRIGRTTVMSGLEERSDQLVPALKRFAVTGGELLHVVACPRYPDTAPLDVEPSDP